MENKIKEKIELPLKGEGIDVVDVKFGEEESVKTLFVTIDSDAGVDTELCVKATRIISPLIDELDLDVEDYILDVGSKGE